MWSRACQFSFSLPRPQISGSSVLVRQQASSQLSGRVMGWWNAFLDRITKSNASSTSYAPLFAVDCTEPLLLTADEPPELTVRDLNKATDSFSAAKLISDGHSITVYKAVLPSGRPAAAKRLGKPPSGTWTASDDAFLRQQVSLLSMVRHDNLVRLLGYTITADLRVLLFELATVGTLHDVLHGPTEVELSWAQRTRIALDAARGLQYLHDAAAVSHYGVSSSMVLLFQGLRAKIADYDVFEQRQRDEQEGYTCIFDLSPNPYHPPEYVTAGHRIPYKTDVYSFGVVLLELLTGRRPHNMRQGYLSYWLVDWVTAILTEGRVEQWIDPKLVTQCEPAEARKLGRIALQCVHDNHRSRPSMGEVVQAISVVVIGN